MEKNCIYSNTTVHYNQPFNSHERSEEIKSLVVYLHLIAYPVLLLICTIGNSLSLSVWLRLPDKSSTAIYLSTVALSDLFVLWFYMGHYVVNVDPTCDHDNSLCWEQYLQSKGVVEWWRDTFLQLSDWTLITFSAERLVVVSRPLKFNEAISKETAIRNVLVLFLLAATFCSELLVVPYYYLWRRADFPPGTTTKIVIGPEMTDWDSLYDYSELLMGVCKWIILTLLNAAFVFQLSRQSQSRPVFASHKLSQQRCRQTRNINCILLGSAALYIVTQAPNAYCKLLKITGSSEECSPFYYPLLSIISLLNYSLDFLLYCMVSARFRRYLLQRKPFPRNSTRSSAISSSSASNNLPLLQGQSVAKNGLTTRRNTVTLTTRNEQE
ncbi:hypothetical protein RvY_02539 [Ramazzottius varieornatus]|uniref:G-protein coupled receptors family 1 profile domain-containing protein n=1 Tax=Ramazzottius varieornatus TaxID=947166 RepID=A0A1D1US48_RAMVA|nr:hypothetical protein RvY_02539 [Ramazzottius varieornatus]